MLTPDMIVATARSWIGTPYRHQASLKGVGCDCLGLVRGVCRDLFGPEPETTPPYSGNWADAVGGDPLLEAARRHLTEAGVLAYGAGDVLLFRYRKDLPPKHCAIATGPDSMLHAHEGAAVTEVAIRPWWDRHLAHVFRFPDGVDL